MTRFGIGRARATPPPEALVPGSVPSATEAWWFREEPERYWDPARRLLRTIRDYQAVQGRFARPRQMFCVLRHRFWSVVTGADIPINSDLGGGLKLPHPNGVVVHPRAKVGVNCLLFQQVTLTGGVVLGGHVDVGAGAKVLGPVRIGDHARIGANAVVTQDVPAGAVAVGVPARIISAPAKCLGEEGEHPL